MEYDYEKLYKTLTRRYGDVSPEALIKVLCPMHVPITSLNKTIHKLPGQQHWRATFTAEVNEETRSVLSVGRTGKFIGAGHLTGAAWKEIAKGRILAVSEDGKTATGEVYVGSKRSDLEKAVEELTELDFLEIDQFGAAAKILSALAESALATSLEELGYSVRRMPEDTAKHIGNYANYDFEVTRDGVTKKLEVKSLWGTDTRYARLIHSTGRDYPTSSCKFATQDFFAVSLFLRTGGISDFAFAQSRPADESPNGLGLPRAQSYPDHVNQNPLCTLGAGVWFSSLDELWALP